MDALVVYESMFGNTKAVAEAVAEGLTAGATRAQVCEVGEAPALQDLHVDLLVVGAPTQAFGLSRPQTRADAAARGGGSVISAGEGVREWLGAADHTPGGLRVASFDTHVKTPMIPGWASHSEEKRLRRLGAKVVGKSHSFYVHGYTGPLLDGELDRARRWGEELAATVGGALVG
ncbi:flavodoxin family protein [Georgenia yuyongxinii]|uniref:Flavodoxin n=1 Tax=Georgenia yuyongxinii TaxID=2589797 RepID=A0A552WJQ7_9MICO|nr:flavodoxin domain-containing protein [Georgenia yuyongxinii]TRW42966.1 flavodoxin [Georgenia yuyongxinii]